MLSIQKITKIRSLRRDGCSMRKIAKRLKISKDTVLKYIKSTPSVEEILPALKIGTTEVTGDVTTNSKDGEWVSIIRDEPLGSITVRGMSSFEFPNTCNPIHDYSYNRDDWPPRRREICFDQPYRGPIYYPEDLNYDDQYVVPRMPGIPVPRIKHGTPEKSTLQIIQEYNDQKQKQELQLLSKKIDRIGESRRADREFEKKLNEIREQKLASDQNKKTESDNLNKISTTNQDNKIGSISHVEELQKTENLEEQKNFTNHESTYTDKNIPIHDHNNDKSAVLDTDTKLILAANIFEGLSPVIGNFIGQELYKFKHNNITPKKVTLIHPIEVNLREVKY